MKKIKYTISLITISILGLTFQTAFPNIAHAVDSTTNANTVSETKATTETSGKTSTESTAQVQKIQNLKTRANTEITKRLTALNSLITKIGTIKKLSVAQKASFTADIQANISSLTALKAKINADTDPTTLQTNVRSIIESYRIFAFYVPKVHLLAGSNIASEVATNLNSLIAKFQSRVATDLQAGKDVTSLQTKISSLQTTTNSINTTAQEITNTIALLEPAGYPGNLTGLQSAQQSLKTIKTNIQTAKQDAQKIIDELKSLKK